MLKRSFTKFFAVATLAGCFFSVTVSAQESYDAVNNPRQYYYNNLESATAGSPATYFAACGSTRSSNAIDIVSGSALNGTKSLSTTGGSTMGYVAWNFMANSATGSNASLASYAWEWEFDYQNTTGAATNDVKYKMTAGSDAWRYYLLASSYTADSWDGDQNHAATHTLGLYLTQYNGNLILRYKYGTATNQYTDYATIAMANNNHTYQIRVERQGPNGYFRIFIYDRTALTTTISSDINIGSGPGTAYNLSFLQATSSAANRFQFDNFNFYKVKLEYTPITTSPAGVSNPVYPGMGNAIPFAVKVGVRGDVYMGRFVINYTGDAGKLFSAATLYKKAIDQTLSISGATSLGSYSLNSSNTSQLDLAPGEYYYSGGSTDGSTTNVINYFLYTTVRDPFNSGYPATVSYSVSNTGSDTYNSFYQTDAGPYNPGSTVSSSAPVVSGNVYDWTGNTSTAWGTGSNWKDSNGQTTSVPGASDVARIGYTNSYSNTPTVSSNAPVAAIIIGTEKQTANTLAVTGGTLAVSGDITITSKLATSSTVAISGAGGITAANLKVGDGTAVNGNNKTFALTSSVNSLTLSGDIYLNSIGSNGQRGFDAGINITGGAVTAGNIITTFTSYNGEVNSVTVTNATLNLTGATPLSSLSTTGTNTISFAGTGATIGYTGAAQTVYTNSAITGLAGGVTYNNLTISGSGTKTIGTAAGATLTVAGNLVTSGTPVVNMNTYNPVVNITGALTNGSGCTITQGSNAVTINGALNNSGTLTGSSATLSVAGFTTLTGGTFTTGSGLVTLTNGLDNTDGVLSVTGNISIGNSIRQFAGTGIGSITFGSGTATIANSVQIYGGTLSAGTGPISFANAIQIFSGATFSGGASPGTMSVVSSFSNAGTFKPGTGTITLKGNYTNSGTFTYAAGTIIFDNPNSAAQTLLDNSSAGTAFNNVTFKGINTSTGVINLTTSGSGKYSVSNTGVLTLGNTTTKLAVAGALTLKSAASGSAAVAVIPAGSSITGSVSVERYTEGGSLSYRAYRLFSSPIYEATVGGNNVYGVAYLKNNAYVTGTSGTGGGFDVAAVTPTMYLYREDKAASTSATGGNFRGINKINNSPSYNLNLDNETGTFNLPVGNGVMFFFRGNRATNSSTSINVVPDAATFTQTGTLNQGTISVKNWYTPSSTSLGNINTRYNLVGNPYACTIDWNSFSSGNSAAAIYGPNLSGTIYTYNPTGKNYATYNGSVGTNNGSRYIPSGQGFYVQANLTGTPTLTFTEAAKVASQQVTGSNLLMSTAVPLAQTAPQYIKLQLTKDSVSKEDMAVQFNRNASTGYIFNEDSPYFSGSSAVSIYSKSADNINLAINQVPFKQNQSITLFVNVNATGIYQLKLSEIKNIPRLFDIWLMDAYKKDSLDIKNNSTYNFNASTAEPATLGAGRFSLMIRQNPAYTYRLLDFTAAKNGTSVDVNWKAENEENYTYFTIERSIDHGKTFDVIGSATGKAASLYGFQDKTPATGENQYRLKQEDYFGTITYSKIVPVMYAPASNAIIADDHITVYPNPVKSGMNIAINPKAETGNATFTISITNTLGRIIKTITANQTNWQGDVGDLLPGTYFVQVANAKDKAVVGKSTFIKL